MAWAQEWGSNHRARIRAITGRDMIKSIKYLLKMHRFFVRQSQHYILGNWAEYCSVKQKKESRYYRRYPSAYLRFMRDCMADALSGRIPKNDKTTVHLLLIT